MSSEAETFETVDWDDLGGGGVFPPRSVLVFLAQVAVLVPWVVWDHETVTEFGYTVAELRWHADALDWLTLFAGAVVVSFVVVPALQRPGRVRTLARRYPRDPASLGALVVVGLVATVGVVGPFLVSPPAFNFELRTQPPLGFSVQSTWTDDCLRPLAGGDRCGGTWAAPLGTTEDGHDVATWLVYGARAAVQIVLVTTTLVAPIAVAVGSVAGYLGGRYDAVLSRVIELQETVPTFIVYFLAVIFVGPTLFVLVLVYGLFDWGETAALVRAEARSIREQSYVRAARSAGASRLDVLRRHVVPNVGDAVLTSVSTLAPKLILIEALLSFLALSGARSNSWGRLIFRAIGPQSRTSGVSLGVGQELLKFDSLWWIGTMPAVAIAVTVIATSVVGDALTSALDTRD
jgi:peptide/nickel transport system permease protein